MTYIAAHHNKPLKFPSVEDLAASIELYFLDCDKYEDTRKYEHENIEYDEETRKKVCTNCWQPARSKGCMLVSGALKLPRPYTVTGLAVWLDTTRQTLLEYQGEVEGREKDPAYADTIRRAKQRIENYAEEKLYDSNYPTRGVIFSLSNNADRWSERKTTDVNLGEDGAKKLADRLFSEAQASPSPDAAPAHPDPAPAGEPE